MPRVALTQENKTGAFVEKWPALKFMQKGEHIRIACLDVARFGDILQIAPWSEWVHTLRGVEVQDGQPLMVDVKDRQGTVTGRTWKTEFVGNPICLGDAQGALKDKGLDPDNCPVCKAARDYPEFVQPPEVRYSMSVLRYNTKPGGWDLAQPFAPTIVCWGFTDRRFNKLADLQTDVANELTPDGKPKDLTWVDLRLGPCEDLRYQKFDIQTAHGVAMWRANDQVKAYVAQMWRTPENRPTDEQLRAACGRHQTNRNYLEMDIAKTIRTWLLTKQAGGPATSDPMGNATGPSPQDMSQGFGDMMNELDGPPTAPAPPAAPAEPAAPPAPPTAPETPAAPAASDNGLDEFLGQPAAPAAPAAPVAPVAPSAAPAVPAAPVAPVAPAAPAAPAPDPLAAPAAPAAEPAAAPAAAPSFDELMQFPG